jgi:hypothetical protein
MPFQTGNSVVYFKFVGTSVGATRPYLFSVFSCLGKVLESFGEVCQVEWENGYIGTYPAVDLLHRSSSDYFKYLKYFEDRVIWRPAQKAFSIKTGEIVTIIAVDLFTLSPVVEFQGGRRIADLFELTKISRSLDINSTFLAYKKTKKKELMTKLVRILSSRIPKEMVYKKTEDDDVPF